MYICDENNKNNIMETEKIGLGIVCTLFLLFFFYIIGKFIYSIIKDEKYSRKAELVFKNANKDYNNFMEFLNSQELLKDSKAYYYFEKVIRTFFENEFLSPKMLEDGKERLERYTDSYKTLNSIINEYQNEIERIKVDISYNISHWVEDIREIPVFFVLESIFDNDKTFCHSPNLQFKKDSQDIIAYVFTDKNKNGYVRTISPKNHKIFPMTKNEFYNKYLISRINLMNFSDFKEYSKYKYDLTKEFFKNYKEDEQ